MTRTLLRAALRFASVVVVAITFTALAERLMPAARLLGPLSFDSFLAFWRELMEPRVAAQLTAALPWTVAIIGTATVLALVVGTLVGAWMGSGRQPGRSAALGIPLLLAACVPAFLIGMVLVAILSQALRWFPPALPFTPTQTWRDPLAVTLDLVSHAVLPVLSIALAGAGTFALTMRGLVTSGRGADHDVMAESLGLGARRRFWGWTIRPALAAQLTAAALALGLVVSGAFLVEVIFSYPGVGWILFQAVIGADLPMMRGTMVLIIVAVALLTTLIDLALPWVDPRIRR